MADLWGFESIPRLRERPYDPTQLLQALGSLGEAGGKLYSVYEAARKREEERANKEAERVEEKRRWEAEHGVREAAQRRAERQIALEPLEKRLGQFTPVAEEPEFIGPMGEMAALQAAPEVAERGMAPMQVSIAGRQVVAGMPLPERMAGVEAGLRRAAQEFSARRQREAMAKVEAGPERVPPQVRSALSEYTKLSSALGMPPNSMAIALGFDPSAMSPQEKEALEGRTKQRLMELSIGLTASGFPPIGGERYTMPQPAPQPRPPPPAPSSGLRDVIGRFFGGGELPTGAPSAEAVKSQARALMQANPGMSSDAAVAEARRMLSGPSEALEGGISGIRGR